MDCQWQPAAMTGIFALPTAVVDEKLRLAGAAQLKVLLWWARSGGNFDPEACSKAVGFSPLDCVDAMCYWQEMGLVTLDGAAPAPAAAAEPPAPAVSLPLRRPYELKPDFGTVMDKQQSDGDFAALLTVAEARLGRTLSHSDMQTLLYLRDTAGLPTEVILLVVEYSLAHGHPHMRYIEKTALGWADDGLTTVKAAESYLCTVERREKAAETVQNLLGISKALTLAESQKADLWLNEWRMETPVILMADEICRKKKDKTILNYIHTILESWNADGASTVDAVLALLGKKPPEEAPSSLDSDAYEQMVAQYRPQYAANAGKEA